MSDTSATSETDAPIGRRASLLDGVKVLDLTRFLAGPFASMILADLGAEVIKVEQISGDSTRNNPPYFYGGDSAYFLSINRNKKSIALDFRAAEGKKILRQLLADTDIILDNLRAPQRESLGLAFEELQTINPRIISCSVTGFGSDGPYNDRPAFDIIVEAIAGVMSLTGPEGGPSVRAGVPIGDITAGLYAVIGALAGLEYRKTSGRGQHIDVSMLDSQMSLLSYLAQYYFVGGLVATHQGRAHVSIPTYNTFATKDGSEIVIAANTQEMWQSLCRVLSRTDLPRDPRFATNEDRLEHRDVLIPILETEFAAWPHDDLHEALVKAEVPVAPINSIDVALADPQIRHREMVIKVPHRSAQPFLSLASPVKPDDALGTDFISPPGLGEQGSALLLELGYSLAEIEQLQAAGVIKIVA